MERKNQEGHLSRRVVLKLWMWFALTTFLGLDIALEMNWSTWLLDEGPAADEWLYEQRHTVRTRFLNKWLLAHVACCAICSIKFGLGLDGKRGMKRAVCACLRASLCIAENACFMSKGCFGMRCLTCFALLCLVSLFPTSLCIALRGPVCCAALLGVTLNV